ncbi:winged helix-turn-helix domain-containing protein [Amycolatopsis sp. NPDC051372]|uniref:winged helix-turn-helix domain-containing protein n=1 Tax=Amycolatopsis sp. NPDC051372 TaxID=3155669 RepID=UPI00343EDA4E
MTHGPAHRHGPAEVHLDTVRALDLEAVPAPPGPPAPSSSARASRAPRGSARLHPTRPPRSPAHASWSRSARSRRPGPAAAPGRPARQGTPVSHTDLLDHGWDAMDHPDSTVLPGRISRLRGKLGDPPLIQAVPGVGYVLAPA